MKKNILLFSLCLLANFGFAQTIPTSELIKTNESTISIIGKINKTITGLFTLSNRVNNLGNIGSDYLSKQIYAPSNGYLYVYSSGLTKAGIYVDSINGTPRWVINSNNTIKIYNMSQSDNNSSNTMLWTIYDINTNNIVDNSEKLNNQDASYYATASSVTVFKSEFDVLKDDFYYVLPTVSFVSSSAGTYEKGSVKTNINLSFNVNKGMVSRTYTNAYNNSLGSGTNNTFVLTTNITTTKTFTINVTDSRTNSSSASQVITFNNRKYFGVSEIDTNTLSNANILSLTTAWASKGNSGTVTPNNQYIYVIYPASFGTCTSFTLGGFGTSPWPVSSRNVTNSSGYVELFYIYRSEYKQNGSISYDIY